MNQKQCIANGFKFAKQAREVANARNNCPIVLTDDETPPTKDGESFCWKTKGGTIIRHPNAYKKSGWSNMEYHHSTICVKVGRHWHPKWGFRLSPII